MQTNDPLIERGITGDTYVVGTRTAGGLSIEISRYPLANQIWFGVAVMLVGMGLVFLFDQRRVPPVAVAPEIAIESKRGQASMTNSKLTNAVTMTVSRTRGVFDPLRQPEQSTARLVSTMRAMDNRDDERDEQHRRECFADL